MDYQLITNNEQLHVEIEKILNATKPFYIGYKEVKNFKSREQLGYFWGGIIPDVVKYFKETGQTIEDKTESGEIAIRNYTGEDICLYFYKNILGIQLRQLPGGEVVPFTKTISELDKKEMSKFINNCLDLIEEKLPDCMLRPWVRYCWINHVNENWYNILDNTNLPQKDESYLLCLRKQSCINKGCRKYIQVYHVKTNKYDGISQKSPDWLTIPLCNRCHYELRQKGQNAFLGGLPLYKFEIELFCKLNYIKWLYKL